MSGLDELLCGHSHRKGPFCAICKDGYGPSINSLFPKCVKCKHSKSSYYWVFYILVAVVPVTIFFFMIMLFHISVTRGALNSFVLFAQLITTTFDITGDGTIPLYSSNSQKAYQVLYNFWNLDFFISVSHGFCLSPKLNTMTVLSFHYFLAFYSPVAVVWAATHTWSTQPQPAQDRVRVWHSDTQGLLGSIGHDRYLFC